MKYQLILFDFDGTLCNTKSAVIESVKRSYQHLGHALPSLEKIQEGLKQGRTAKDTLQYISTHAKETVVQTLLQKYKENYIAQSQKQAVLFPGVIELLKKLKAHHIQSVIVSNQVFEGLECLIEKFDLKHYIHTFIGGEPGKFCKPDVNVYTDYLAPHFPGLSLDNVLMVGDTSTDLHFAKAVGIDVCWAAYGDGNAVNCRALHPQYTINEFSALDRIIFPL